MTEATERAPRITSIIVGDGELYAVTDRELTLPIYVFGPLVDYPEGLNVPIVDKYEETLREFVAGYFPIPLPPKEHLPTKEEAPSGFWSRVRDDKEDSRPWVQAVYGGFPLYIYGNGTTNETPKKMPLFRPATIQLSGGPVKGEGEPPLIPPGYGP